MKKHTNSFRCHYACLIILGFLLAMLPITLGWSQDAPAENPQSGSYSRQLERSMHEYDCYEVQDECMLLLPEKDWRAMQSRMQEMHDQIMSMHGMMRDMQCMPMMKRDYNK